MNPIDTVLPLLAKVRRRQVGQWSACCPAHDDQSPSLSVRETAEGAVLLHCFAGCNVAEVVGSLGLEMSALFPPCERPANAPPRLARLLTQGQALEILGNEAQLVGLCAGNMGHGIALSDEDRARVLQAAGRIAFIRTAAMP